MAHTDTRPVLVVGSLSTPAHLSDLTAFAYDAADKLKTPATVSTWADSEVPDVDITRYSAVVMWTNWENSLSAAMLIGAAFIAGVPVLDDADLQPLPETDVCTWCLTRDEDEAQPEPQLIAGTWTPAVCELCAPMVRKGERDRQRAARKLVTVTA